MEIKKMITPYNRTVMSNKKNEFIVIHYVGAVSSARANAIYFQQKLVGDKKASAHYFVDEKDIYQVVENKDVAWHCGAKYYKHLRCRNTNSIGIEMCCYRNSKGEIEVSEEVEKRTIELTKELMKKYNIPIQNILRHYDVTGKNCPAPFVRNNNRWINFLNKLSKSEGKYKAGDVVEIDTPFLFTGAVEGNRYLYDNKTELCWVGENTRTLIKNDRLVARVIIAYVENDKYIVQIPDPFNDQFWISENNIVKKL
jgi:N-acetylmuramoyl-L-alanine amidase